MSFYTSQQVLNQCLDRTDPDAPALRVLADLEVGDLNIGNVDVVSLPSLPAGSNTVGNVGAPDLATAAYAVVACDTTADPLVSAVDATRKSMSIFNHSATLDLYIGPDASVTTSNAPIKLPPLTGVLFERQDGFAKFRWHGITASGSVNAGVMEGKE